MEIFKKSSDGVQDFFKKTGVISIITSIIFGVLGIILISNPSDILTVLCYILGGIFLVIGAFKVFSYFMGRGKYNLYNQDLAFGLIAIVAGLVVIFAKDTIMSIISIIVGIWVIYSGLVRLGLGIKLKKVKSEYWITVAVIAAIMITCGVYMIINQSVVYTAIGIIMLVYAVLDLVESVIYMKTVKQLF